MGSFEGKLVAYCFHKVSGKTQVTYGKSIYCLLLSMALAFLGWPSAGAVQGPVAKDLDNITIQSRWISSGTATLRNGGYRGPAVPGSATLTVVKLTDWRAFGFLNGRSVAAVILMTDPGGSGFFYDLVLLAKNKEGWGYIDSIPLGDRVKVHAIGIDNNAIVVSMAAHGPGDAMCCPTQEESRRFTVQSDHLAPEQQKSSAPEPGIVGPVWQWVQTQYADRTTLIRPADATGYTLQFHSDGKVNIRGDCNAGGGTFTSGGSKLSITITHTTLAACPKDSLEQSFIRDLNSVGGFR